MRDKGNGATAECVLSEGIAKAGLLSSVVNILESGERDSFASLDFILGLLQHHSKGRERERESRFKT